MDEVIEFIDRRFKTDCNWISGNCYYFAEILKLRFPEGVIFYDVIYGHFVFLYKGKYYDWTGSIKPDGILVNWEKFEEYDHLQKERIVTDCIM